MERSAIISECKLYRYQLLRRWDPENPKLCMFLMLNPSVADGMNDDPTVRRCINFAKSWGYGGIMVGNMFAFRATNPKHLYQAEDPVGPDNLKYLKEMSDLCEIVVLAYGNNKITIDLLVEKEIKPLKEINLKKMRFIKLSKTGTPMHPLYLKADLQPDKFHWQSWLM